MLMGAWDLCFEKWKIGSENVTDRSRGDSGVVVDKPMVEVSKSKECLDVLNFLGFQPVEYSLNFGRVHR
jgi:hypothetical protein